MADLIIQPKNDDHLKLNNDAGTTIVELANDESKLRLAQNNISASDGTTAITTSGANVTLAGTSNNIGTATGTFNGTFGGSFGSVSFPAGHVIKTSMFTSTATNPTESSGSMTDSGITSGSFSHGSGNKVLIIANCQIRSSNEGWVMQVNGATGGPDLEFYNSSNADMIMPTASYVFLDSPSGTSTTYTIRFRRNYSGTATFYNSTSKMVLMEIEV